MANNDFFFLYDDTEQTITRFVSFAGDAGRWDLAIITSDRFFGKKVITDLQRGRTAIIGHDDLQEEGYLAYAFGINEEEAEDLHDFLQQIL